MKFKLLFLLLAFGFLGYSQLNQVDSKGRKQGLWAKPYEGVNVYQYRGQFKNDKPTGKFTYYYKSSKVKAVINHDENSNRSVAYFYHEAGTLMSYGIYSNQLKDSVWVNFGPSKRVSNTETYKNGTLNGKKIIFYVPTDINDKSRLAAAVYNYVDDTLQGDFKELFENQTIMRTGQYSKNKKVGMWISYHPNGKRMMLTKYRKGQRHGWCLAYDKKGIMSNRQYYYYGQLLEGEKRDAKIAERKAKGVGPYE